MSNLGIDYKLIIAQIVNFVLLFIIFKKFIAKPFSRFIEGERKKEEEKTELMARLTKDTEALESQRKELKQEQRKEMDKILNEVRAEGEELKRELTTKAQKEAAEILARAKSQIEEERNRLQKEMKLQVTTLSTLLVEKGLQSYLSEDRQREVTRNILNNLPKELNT